MLRDFLKPKIATKLTGWFLLITLVPLAVIVYLATDRGREQLQNEIMNKLVVMTVERVGDIENYIRETQRTLELLVMQPSAIRASGKRPPSSSSRTTPRPEPEGGEIHA